MCRITWIWTKTQMPLSVLYSPVLIYKCIRQQRQNASNPLLIRCVITPQLRLCLRGMQQCRYACLFFMLCLRIQTMAIHCHKPLQWAIRRLDLFALPYSIRRPSVHVKAPIAMVLMIVQLVPDHGTHHLHRFLGLCKRPNHQQTQQQTQSSHRALLPTAWLVCMTTAENSGKKPENIGSFPESGILASTLLNWHHAG